MTSRQRIVALTVACALFMQTLDSSVLGTALPAIGRDFGLDPVHLHLAMTSYLIALAVFMPMSGWIADSFGTRTVLRIAIVIFVGASVGCGYSSSIGELAVMRIIQGMGGAMKRAAISSREILAIIRLGVTTSPVASRWIP